MVKVLFLSLSTKKRNKKRFKASPIHNAIELKQKEQPNNYHAFDRNLYIYSQSFIHTRYINRNTIRLSSCWYLWCGRCCCFSIFQCRFCVSIVTYWLKYSLSALRSPMLIIHIFFHLLHVLMLMLLLHFLLLLLPFNICFE